MIIMIMIMIVFRTPLLFHPSIFFSFLSFASTLRFHPSHFSPLVHYTVPVARCPNFNLRTQVWVGTYNVSQAPPPDPSVLEKWVAAPSRDPFGGRDVYVFGIQVRNGRPRWEGDRYM